MLESVRWGVTTWTFPLVAPAVNTRHVLLTIAAAAVGVAVSSAHPAGIIAALLLPALVFRQPSRRTSHAAATCYYAGALWPLAVSARNFFGPDLSVAGVIAFWALCARAAASQRNLIS